MVLSTYQVSRKEIKKKIFLTQIFSLLFQFCISYWASCRSSYSSSTKRSSASTLSPTTTWVAFTCAKCFASFDRNTSVIFLQSYLENSASDQILCLTKSYIWSNLISDQILYLIKSDIWSNWISDICHLITLPPIGACTAISIFMAERTATT